MGRHQSLGRMRLLVCFALAIAPLVGACSTDSVANIVANEIDDAAEARDSGSVEPDAHDAGASVPLACGAHAVTGPLRAVEPINSFPPANLGNTGGQVTDGHYVATRFRRFGTSTAGARKAADLWIANGRYEWEEDDEKKGIWSSAGTISYDASAMTMAHDCPKNYALPFRYSATAADLVLSLSDGQGHTLIIDMAIATP